jgi:hypothetical protein
MGSDSFIFTIKPSVGTPNKSVIRFKISVCNCVSNYLELFIRVYIKGGSGKRSSTIDTVLVLIKKAIS